MVLNNGDNGVRYPFPFSFEHGYNIDDNGVRYSFESNGVGIGKLEEILLYVVNGLS